VLADSPLFYLPMGESSGTTATDASGNGRHGTYVNSPTLGAAALLASEPGVTSVDFELSSASQYALVTDDNSLDGLTAMTLEAWIRPESLINFQQIAARDDVSGAGRSFQWRTNGGTGKIEFIRIPGTTVTATSSSALSTATTYHVAVVYNGTDIRLYINGALNGTPAACTGSIGTSTTDLRIAARRHNTTGNTTDFYDGLLGHFAAYNTALSAARIAAHYTAGIASPSDASASLVGEGVMSAAGLTTIRGSAPLVGEGNLAASGNPVGGVATVTGSASLVGEGLLAASPFIPFEPPTVGAGFPLRFSAYLSPPLSVDVDDVVPFGRVASSVSED
jgi:hypothetical protein